MPKKDSALERVRAICLALPDTKETITWGKPHFRVGEKIFAGYGEEDGRAALGFKLERAHAEAILDDPRFRRAPYVGHHGWVSMDATAIDDWDQVRELVHESYRLIAPKSLVSRMSGATPAAAAPRKPSRTAATAPARKKAAKKAPGAAPATTARRAAPAARGAARKRSPR